VRVILPRPAHIYHADWSKDATKRWSCKAARHGDGRYFISAPQPVGDLGRFVELLRASTANGPVLAGFDFPIGFPRAYGERAGITDFRRWLATFDGWPDLRPVSTLEEVTVQRPFYPLSVPVKGVANKGAFRKRLLERDVVAGNDPLLRGCDVGSGGRTACSLFWTIGPNQVGQAAVSGWRDVLKPLLANDEYQVAIWPFDGSLVDLLAVHRVTVVETYPAEFYSSGYFGADLTGPAGEPFAKSKQLHLEHATRKLLAWATAAGCHVEDEGAYLQSIAAGKDDAFDALIGCLGMFVCLQRPWSELVHASPIEGWIFGRSSGSAELSFS
jgi:hypothetical protein